MRSSLYWKIIATFLVVIFAAVIAGSTVFSLVSQRLLSPVHRESVLAFARMGVREIELALAQQMPLERLTPHLVDVYHDFPHLTVLYSTPDGRVLGKEEPGRPELRAALADVVRTGLAPGGHRLEFLGPGRGAYVALPVGPGGRRGYALLSGRGAMEDMLPAVLRAATASLAAVFTVAAILGLMVFRVLGRRLGAVRACLLGVADGQLALRVPGPGDDEIGQIGNAFNKMAERLERSVVELASIDERRRRFLADVSHELKTPVTALRGNLERLLPTATDATRKPLHVAYEEVDRLFLLIEDLLELAKMDATDFSLRREEEVLQRIAARAAERFQVALENRGIALTTRLSPEPVRRAVDARRLEQVIANLILNAIHSMPDGGRIEVAVTERDGKALLEVADDGPGIPQEQRDKVFERFYTGTGPTGGTGLGLSIVKRLVEAHGGSVRLTEGLAGRGTRALIEI